MSCIAIDCRFAAVSAGLGTYTRGLVPELVKALKGHHVCLLVRSEQERWLQDISSDVTITPLPAKHYSVKEQLLLPYRLRQLGADVLYAPHFNVPLLSKVPVVVTIHDLILHAFPNNASLLKRLAYKFVMSRAVAKAKSIIAVSTFTATEVHNTYGKNATVVTEGYDPMFTKLSKADTDAVLTTYGLLGKYFLYVGSAKEHKNVQMLITAHAESDTDIPLVLVMSGKEADALNVPSTVIKLSNVPTRDLPALYNGATCFVTASLHEGFCLPILEARACGTPIIATNATAIPEVAGAHALLCEPTVAAFAAAFTKPPSTSDVPEPTYSWKAAAKEVSAILSSSL